MGKSIAYIVFILLINSCKSQQKVIESIKTDIIVFNVKNDSMNFINNKFNTHIYTDYNFILIQQRRRNIGFGYGEKYYNFINKNKDTMNIKCFCPQENDYYFKNIAFKKGTYELNIDYKFRRKQNSKPILGKNIKSSKEIQKILFKNVDYEQLRNPEYKDLEFKDLKFIEIDLNDTINVKLTEIKTSANKVLPKAGLNEF